MTVLVKDETKKVMRAARTGAITSLGRAGAYIRGIAIKSIRRAKGASAKGQPPHSSTGRLKRSIFFSVEKAARRVVIGAAFGVAGSIARTHEHGGREGPKEHQARRRLVIQIGGVGPLRKKDKKSKKGHDRYAFARLRSDRQVRRARELEIQIFRDAAARNEKIALLRSKPRKYPKRPFMGPALERSKARLPAFWAKSVKGK